MNILIFDFISDIFSSIAYSNSLNTRKIDQNIARLNKTEWFKEIYGNEKYRRLFFANRHVRGYLQSSLKVNRMLRKKDAQHKFIIFLEKQIK